MSVNPLLDNLLDDAEKIGLKQAAREYIMEIAGHYGNLPVNDFGEPAVIQVARLAALIIAELPTSAEGEATRRRLTRDIAGADDNTAENFGYEED